MGERSGMAGVPCRYKAKIKGSDRVVTGYYVKHIKRQPNPVGDRVKPEDIEHLIIFDGFADWDMPRGIECAVIDLDTLEEADDEA